MKIWTTRIKPLYSRQPLRGNTVEHAGIEKNGERFFCLQCCDDGISGYELKRKRHSSFFERSIEHTVLLSSPMPVKQDFYLNWNQ